MVLQSPFGPRKPEPLMLTNSMELFNTIEYVVVRVGSVERFFTVLAGQGSSSELVLSIRVVAGKVSSSLARVKPGDGVEVRFLYLEIVWVARNVMRDYLRSM
jgi:NAD(P)H-flavin reductase